MGNLFWALFYGSATLAWIAMGLDIYGRYREVVDSWDMFFILIAIVVTASAALGNMIDAIIKECGGKLLR